MAWLVWHMTRVADRFIHARFQEAGQLWDAGGWHDKFGMDSDPDEFGIGWSTQQVADWDCPSRDVLMGYYDAVNARRPQLHPGSRCRGAATPGSGARSRRVDHVGGRRSWHPGLG